MVALAAWSSRCSRLNSDMYLHRLESGSRTSPPGRGSTANSQQGTSNNQVNGGRQRQRRRLSSEGRRPSSIVAGPGRARNTYSNTPEPRSDTTDCPKGSNGSFCHPFGARLKKRTDGVSEQNTPSVRTFVSSEQTRAAALAISKSNRCTNNQERQGRRLGRGDRVDDHIIEPVLR